MGPRVSRSAAILTATRAGMAAVDAMMVMDEGIKSPTEISDAISNPPPPKVFDGLSLGLPR
uniref:Uncharacterized protein n=1 Tax=Arundo donax TaxID=35708 RepID=A0A0A8YQZ2_ARUDO